MKNKAVYVATILAIGCSPVSFQGEAPRGTINNGQGMPTCEGDCIFPGSTGINGIDGGHFDLDTSTQIYQVSKGTTNHHVHEYDKAHQTTTVDFFNLIDSKFNNIQDTIPAGKRFVLNIVNAPLSPGGVLEVNGASKGVVALQSTIRNQTYVIGAAAGGDISLTKFRLGFAANVLANGGLVPTATGCVRSNDPGKIGEYRSGALTIQALDTNYQLDPKTGAASQGLLWEATVFWHWDGGCY